MMKPLKYPLLLILFITLFLTGCTYRNDQSILDEASLPEAHMLNSSMAVTAKSAKPVAKDQRDGAVRKDYNDSTVMQVHFIDVGQADCILIESEDKFMLVDGGNREDSNLIMSYLKDAGVKRLEYVIGTHPHEDHIGSLDVVIRNFEIGRVILPPVTHTSQTFEDVLDAIEKKELKITKPVVGKSYGIGDGEFMILSPNEDYGDHLNNWSVGIKLTNGNNSFILCGDVEKEAEADILENEIDLDADVLKASHHGAETSNNAEFLKAVRPDYVVISSGAGNSYGHPHKEVIDCLKEQKIRFFRTDSQGTIIASSDGTTITWNTEPSDNYKGGTDETDNIKNDSKPADTYILNTNTKKFHYETCRSVKQMSDKNKKTSTENRKDIIKQGYDPCGICKP